MERRPARPDEVGRHQRLAVPGRQGVTGPQRGRRQDRHEQDDRRQVRGPEDRRQVAAAHAARHGCDIGRRRGARRPPTGTAAAGSVAASGGSRLTGSTSPAPGTGVASGMSNGGSVGPARRDDDRRPPCPSSAWVSRFVGYAVEPAGRRRGSQRAAGPGDRHAGTLDHDLAPAEAIGERRSAKARRAPAASGASQRRGEAAHEAHRRQPADAGRERQTGLVERERQWSSVQRQAQRQAPAPRTPSTRPASASSSETSPSPSVSKSRRAWKVGISAWSMTMSSRIRSASTRMPA